MFLLPFDPYVARLSSLIASVESNRDLYAISRSELDNHANMPVVRSHVEIFDDTGKTCTVNSFSESAGKIENIKIVDAVMAYDCPYRAKTFLLLMRNALHVPEFPLNLLPPFILREGGVQVDECPKFQSVELSVENHSMYCRDADLRIHFELNNTFSSFCTRKPTEEEFASCDKVFITPDSVSWDPYSDHFARNEDAMLDSNGDLMIPTGRELPLVTDQDLVYDVLPFIADYLNW